MKDKLLNTVLDSTVLTIALVIDLVLNVICMIIIAPGPLESVGFIGLAIIVVLFGVRAWLKGGWNGKALWFTCAIIALFFDVSLTLESTKIQTANVENVITLETDSVLQEYRKLRSDAEDQRRQLNEGFTDSVRGTTIDAILQERKQINNVIVRYDDLIISRTEEVLNSGGRVRRTGVSGMAADDIFNAIPNSVKDKRFIPLIVFTALFIVLQLTIITAATDSVKGVVQKQKKSKQKRRIEKIKYDKKIWNKPIDIWLDIVYRNDKPTLPSEVDFFEMLKLNKTSLSKSDYNRIMRAAHNTKVIVDGEVMEENREKAKEKIIMNKIFSLG